MNYPHKIDIKEIPVPAGTIQVRIESEIGEHTTIKEFYADKQTFLEFWKPLVSYYERIEDEIGNK
jgi:hypothetical protein